eukprot:3010740-Prymnesium_polylepis.3
MSWLPCTEYHGTPGIPSVYLPRPPARKALNAVSGSRVNGRADYDVLCACWDVSYSVVGAGSGSIDGVLPMCTCRPSVFANRRGPAR